MRICDPRNGVGLPAAVDDGNNAVHAAEGKLVVASAVIVVDAYVPLGASVHGSLPATRCTGMALFVIVSALKSAY